MHFDPEIVDAFLRMEGEFIRIKDKYQEESVTIRNEAEAELMREKNWTDKLSKSEAQRLLHELQVREIELNLKNQELYRAQKEIKNLAKFPEENKNPVSGHPKTANYYTQIQHL